METDNLAYSLPNGQDLFRNVKFLLRKGDGVALIGANGTGKTTLLRIIVGEIHPKAGSVKIGNRVKIGYFSQQHEGLNLNGNVLNEIVYGYGLTEENARNLLGAFLFKGDDVYRTIGELSGGEQSRLAFLKLMLTGANFLVLDEPTNHLDISSKEAVENALRSFDGTFLIVSHDRYFLERTTNRTLELDGGTITEYQGSYEYYRQKKAQEEMVQASPLKHKKVAFAKNAAKASEPLRKKADVPSAKRSEKHEQTLNRLEAQIAMAEAELKGLEYAVNQKETQQDPAKSREMADLYAAKEQETAKLYAEWEKLVGEEG